MANRLSRDEQVECTFRVSGKQPELWDPINGRIRPAVSWSQVGDRTTIPLDLTPCGSIFVVFRHHASPATAASAGRNSPRLSRLHEIPGPWNVHFETRWGGPASAEFPELISWTKRPEDGIKFYSGTATYAQTFDLPESLAPTANEAPIWLDLGDVRQLAEVRLNGKNLGVLWSFPFRAEVTGILRATDNELEVDVVNFWPNRVIGDQSLPAEDRFTRTNIRKLTAETPLVESGLLGPVTLQTVATDESTQPPAQSVSAERMQQIYEEVKTPHKHGIVLEPPEGKKIDCPTVFRHSGRWYMVYIQLERDPVGYITQLAVSDDLLHWQPLGTILPRGPTGSWDQHQAAGGIALCDTRWAGGSRLSTFDDKYWLSYLGGAKPGYETPPLSISLAWTLDPTQAGAWQKLPTPVLRPSDADVRPFERDTLFKSHVIHDASETLGAPLVMFYNARAPQDSERIGIAVSNDLLHWKRYGDVHVLENVHPEGSRSVISGDPQIVRIDDLWVMFYFGAFWKPGAFDTFACSRDLIHWTKWNGTDLVSPSEPWDRPFAHKPWVLKHDGIVYHYYCAEGSRGRVIALATSKPIGNGRGR